MWILVHTSRFDNYQTCWRYSELSWLGSGVSSYRRGIMYASTCLGVQAPLKLSNPYSSTMFSLYRCCLTKIPSRVLDISQPMNEVSGRSNFTSKVADRFSFRTSVIFCEFVINYISSTTTTMMTTWRPDRATNTLGSEYNGLNPIRQVFPWIRTPKFARRF